jgi:WD40 repeat protein
MTAEHSEGQGKSRVFLSYSRKDRGSAETLRDRLAGDGYGAYLDVHDIVAGEPWQERLEGLIAVADAVLFLISPDSVGSPICDWEVNEAERLAKRIFPVVIRATPDDAIPGRLRRLNYVGLDAEIKWATEYPKLCAALDQDIRWVREHTRLTELAARWAREGRPESQLLRLAEVLEARKKLEAGRPTDAILGDVLNAFLDASQDKETEDRKRLLTTIGRAFVPPFERAMAEERHDVALRFAAAGTILSEDIEMQLVPERAQGVLAAAEQLRARLVLRGHKDGLHGASFSPNGSRIVTAAEDKTARVWDAANGRELAVLQHEGWVRHASFSPDGSRIVTACDDNTARVWDAATWRELAILRGHEGHVELASFNADGSRIVTASWDCTARVWDAAGGRELAVLRAHRRTPVSASFSPDGSRVLTAGDVTARVWDASNGRELAVLSGHENTLFDASFNADGSCIVTAAADNTARIWRASRTRKPMVLRHEHYVSSASFSNDGLYVVTACDDKTARLWSALTGEERAVLRGHEDSVNEASFISDGGHIVTRSRHEVRIWEYANELAVLRTSQDIILRSASVSADRSRVVTTSNASAADVWVWDLANGREFAVLHGHEGDVVGASFSADGSHIVTAAKDNTARVWDASTRQELAVLRHEDSVNSAAFNGDASCVVTASVDRTARVWGAGSGRELAVLPHGEAVASASYSADGSRIVTASKDRTARVWDAFSGRELAVFRHDTAVSCASFHPDGSRIVTGAADGIVRVWDAASARELAVLPVEGDRVASASFDADGARIVTASGQETVQVWDAATGRNLATLKVPVDVGRIENASFSVDGSRIVTAAGEAARVWDAVSGRELTVLTPFSSVNCASFSADGSHIVTGSNDDTVRLWDVGATRALTGDVTEVLAALLTNGRGQRTDSERSDVLMQSIDETDDDLSAALVRRLEALRPGAALRVAQRAEILGRTRHAGCYLTRFQRTMGSARSLVRAPVNNTRFGDSSRAGGALLLAGLVLILAATLFFWLNGVAPR